MDIMSGIGGLY